MRVNKERRTNSLLSRALGSNTRSSRRLDSRHLAALALVVCDGAGLSHGRGSDAGQRARGDLGHDAREVLSSDGGGSGDGRDEGE